jgi:phosphoglycerate dehydrogenase-like enzyme
MLDNAERNLGREWASGLRNEVPGVTVLEPNGREETISALENADAAFGILPPDLLPHARKLRWLQAPAAGPDPGYYYPELADHPVTVTNLRGLHHDVVSTHAVALLLALSRALPLYLRQQVRREWLLHHELSHYLHLPDATILVVGVGEIGLQVARQLAGFGCRVIATDARQTQPPEHVDELFSDTQLAEVVHRADAVIVTVPHTPETEGLFDRDMISRMKSTAVLINVGRGPVVDIDALATAIAEGRLKGAGLDVFPEEPLAVGHPLWDLETVIVTPHSAGAGFNVTGRAYEILRDNAIRFGAGEPLRNVVDKELWF